MALWDKLRVELDRAGRVAQDAIDESKLRLEAFRARQLADRAAQALGYAVFRARTRGETLEEVTLQRLVDALAERDREVTSLEERIREARHHAGGSADSPGGTGSAHGPHADPPEPPADLGENPSPS